MGVVQYSKLKAQLNDSSIIGAWYKMMIAATRKYKCDARINKLHEIDTTGVVQYSKLKAQLNDGSIIGAW